MKNKSRQLYFNPQYLVCVILTDLMAYRKKKSNRKNFHEIFTAAPETCSMKALGKKRVRC